MSLVEKEEVLRTLRSYNPWWNTGSVPGSLLPKLHRTPYFEAKRFLNDKKIKRAVVLTGPRRVGKTTILNQLINSLIDGENVNPRSIIYLTLDHPILKMMSLDEMLEMYGSEIAPTDSGRYVFIDELQYHDQPVSWLKVAVDRHPDWRFVVTGSASIMFRREEESGVGRTVTILVPTLSFFEYLSLRKVEGEGLSLPDTGKRITPTGLGKMERRDRIDLLSKLRAVKPEFNRYLMQGGFPETALAGDLYTAQRLLREDIVDKVLKRDMAAFYGVRKLPQMERLFIYLCIHSGGIVNVSTLAKELGNVNSSESDKSFSTATVNDYLEAFEGAHLLRQVRRFGQSGKKYLKGQSKWYAVDASMRNAVLLRGEEVLTDPDEASVAVMEAAVINHLVTYSYAIRPQIGYWKGDGEKEVDLVIEVPSQKGVAVEVKYRESVSLDRNEGIFQYLRLNPQAVGIVVVKDADDFESRRSPIGDDSVSVTLVPAYAFLYLLGKFEYERVSEEFRDGIAG